MTRALDIAVVGPGAIGGTLAAWMAVSPDHDVSLCVRTPFDRLVVEMPDGRTLEPALRQRQMTDEPHPVDWVVAATKAYDTTGAREWVGRLVGPETSLAVVQNGVEHMERFDGLVPPARTLPVMVDLSAERRAPGHIRQRRPGRIVVPAGELGRRFSALFAASPIAFSCAEDFTTEAWSKLALNSAGVVQALTGKPAGVVEHAGAAALMHGIALETIRVGRAVGARLEDALADHILERFRATSPAAGNSILADRLAGRPLEIDARNGVVVRLGRAHGVATPLNEMAVAILEAATTP